jgi:hypothetical protein
MDARPPDRAMKGDYLYDVVDFILNHASENELEVVRSALKRRVEGDESGRIAGINPSSLARKIASDIRKQIGGSIEQIREMVRNYAVEIIRKDAPELSQDKIDEVLDALMPESVQDGASEAAEPLEPPLAREEPPAHPALPAPESGTSRRGLPPAALATMITQFISYSTQSMSISEQMRLNDEIPEWHKKYWEAFSPRQRQIVSLFLKGQIDEATFWQRIRTDIGLHEKPQPGEGGQPGSQI